MRDLKELTLQELKAALKEWQEPAFRAGQVFSWVYQKGVLDFEAMANLPQGLRLKLKENFSLCGLKIVDALESSDGTKKLLFELKDKNLIEGVLIPAKNRVTACISTQAGCKFGCRFCASGTLGFKRSLSSAEILDEVILLKNNSSGGKLTHIVFMGTGEPLDNYDNVLKSIRLINAPEGLNIGARRITISTCGVIPGIKRLASEGLQVELSISLHAADGKTRSLILPVNRKYPLAELMAACKEYISRTGRQITFEYILIEGVNAGLQNAKDLVKILKPLELCKVNLIPANPIPELKVAPPDKRAIAVFKSHLLRSGVPATLRAPRGQDIEAACGQLRLKIQKSK